MINDPEYQQAGGGEETPAAEETREGPAEIAQRLGKELMGAIDEAQDWYARMAIADDTRFCQWPGQTDDGLKHKQNENDDDPYPWEGASDTRIRLVDEKVRESMRKRNAGFRRGRWQLSGVEGHDTLNAGTTTTFLRWLVFSQLGREGARQRLLADGDTVTYGLGILGTEWRKEKALEPTELTLGGLLATLGIDTGVDDEDDLEALEEALKKMKTAAYQALPPDADAAAEQAQDLLRQAYEKAAETWELVTNAERAAEFIAALRNTFPDAKEKSLKRAAKELRQTGRTSVPKLITLVNRPEWRALKPFVDVFFPTSATSLETADWVARRELLTEVQLKEKAKSEKWRQAFIDEALKTKGKTALPSIAAMRAKSRIWQGARLSEQQDLGDRIEVFHFFHRCLDDEDVPGLYRTTVSLAIGKDGQAKGKEDCCCARHELYGPARLRPPFEANEFFPDSQRLLDNIGLGIALSTHQLEKKSMRDGRIDLAGISITPAAVRHLSDMDTPLRFGPKEVQYESVPNSLRFLQPPNGRAELGVEIEKAVDADANRYAGSADGLIPPPTIALHDQELCDNYNEFGAAVLMRTLELCQQYMPEQTVIRVTGRQPTPFKISKEDIRGAYDLAITFDAQELNGEYREKKIKMAAELLKLNAAKNLDQDGLFAEFLALIDPYWAEMYIRDAQAGTNAEVVEAMQAIGFISSGQQPPLYESGINFGLRLSVLDQWLQNTPDGVAIAGGQLGPYKQQLADTYRKNLQQGVTQQENAVIGRLGAMPMQ